MAITSTLIGSLGGGGDTWAGTIALGRGTTITLGEAGKTYIVTIHEPGKVQGPRVNGKWYQGKSDSYGPLSMVHTGPLEVDNGAHGTVDYQVSVQEVKPLSDLIQ